ncbi:MAG TPA: GtrA family protein [Candidatus Binatia bacterium]|jgi:putative flippase GtrA|nr:GtrA family protein [Candidatus Binatia bacterium]
MRAIIEALIEAFIDSRKRLAAQFLKFAAVGAFNTVLDFGVYLWLTRSYAFWGAHIVGAASVSFVLAATSSFLLNNFWTFGQDAAGWHRRVPKFFVVALGGLLWNAAILHLLTTAGVHDIIAKLVATGVVLIWNFTLQKKWTFRA